MTADSKGLRWKGAVMGNNSLEFYGFSIVFLGIFHQVSVPECIVSICNDNDICIDIKRKRILNFIVFHFSVCIFVCNIGSAADGTHQLMEFHFVHIWLESIEDDQFTGVEFVHNQTAHVGIVVQKGSCICKEHFLIDSPVIWNGIEQRLQLPHAIVFDDHSLCTAFCQQFL